VNEGEIPVASSLDADNAGGEVGGQVAVWREVDDLSSYGPDDRVFTLDPLNGIVTFGDGINGAAVPPGFRHISAARYRAGGGAAGAIDAESASTLLSAAPFIAGVSNPLPASGGRNRESQIDAVTRGPQEIRARGRAVTVADYALLAWRTPGAQVERAHAVAGLHPSYPGNPIPGVVGVFVVPPDRGDGPPTPDQETLRAVAEFLSSEAAPAGIEVVAASPRYQSVRAEVGILIVPEADAGEAIRKVSRALSTYFHPLTGGDDGKGWPFGGAIRYPALLRLINGVDGVRAVGRLNIVIDGFRIASCSDYAISPDSLLWPEVNTVTVMEEEVEL
jgi:predicted phage baseplate assembly protein